MNLKNIPQKVLIIGAGRGLGKSLVANFVANEYMVSVIERNEQICKEYIEKYPKFIEDIWNIDPLVSRDFLQKEFSAKGYIPDIIISTLGGTVKNDYFHVDSSLILDAIRLNLCASVEIINILIDKMIQKGHGRIVFIGSDASLTGDASPSYVIAKAALNGYIKASARYYAKFNISIFGILPGVFEFDDSVWSKKKESDPERYKEKILAYPLKRFLTADEVASTVFGISVSSGIALNGSLIVLNGGAF